MLIVENPIFYHITIFKKIQVFFCPAAEILSGFTTVQRSLQVQAHQCVLPAISLDPDTSDALVCLEELVALSICMCTSSCGLCSSFWVSVWGLHQGICKPCPVESICLLCPFGGCTGYKVIEIVLCFICFKWHFYT